jgi:hypothetical protein
MSPGFFRNSSFRTEISIDYGGKRCFTPVGQEIGISFRCKTVIDDRKGFVLGVGFKDDSFCNDIRRPRADRNDSTLIHVPASRVQNDPYAGFLSLPLKAKIQAAFMSTSLNKVKERLTCTNLSALEAWRKENAAAIGLKTKIHLNVNSIQQLASITLGCPVLDSLKISVEAMTDPGSSLM